MRALSLLPFIGLDGDADNEGRKVAKFLNLDFAKLKHIAHQMVQRGLVIKRGRYRYVTPSLLAVWFAEALWEVQGDQIVSDLLPQFDRDTALRLFERLGEIGIERFARPIVENIFGPGGDKANIDSLDDEAISRLFSLLVNAAPVTCARALERIFKGVSQERLREFRRGRRQIIYALERLLAHKETFFSAARILLKLAASENESWDNNASGTWRDIFYSEWGLSPFPTWERHVLIEEAIIPTNPIEMRLLGVKALFSSVTPFQFSSYGSPSSGRLPERWRPEVWDDLWKTYRSALQLLDRLLDDVDERVALAATDALIDLSRMLLRTPLKVESLNRLDSLHGSSLPHAQKRKLIDVLDQILEFELKALSEIEVETIRNWHQELLGSTYHDRLHRWVGQLHWNDQKGVYREKENPVDLERILTDLASEGYTNPDLLRSEFTWLFSREAQRSGRIANELGKLDAKGSWLDDLLSHLPYSAAFLAHYLVARHSNGGKDWVETLLGEWVQDRPELAEATFLTLQQLDASDQHGEWLLQLIGNKWLSVDALGTLWRYGWITSASEKIFMNILKVLTAVDQPKYTSMALGLCDVWIPQHHNHTPNTADFVVTLLSRIPYDPTVSHASWDHWQNLCTFYLRAFPKQIAEAAIYLMRAEVQEPRGFNDERIFVLKETLKVASNIVWPIIGNFLIERYHEGYTWVSISVGDEIGTLLETVDYSVLLAWIKENGLVAAQTLSRYVSIEQTPLPLLARELLTNFGSDRKVRNALRPDYRSASWWGSYSSHLQEMLVRVQSWLTDDSDAVRTWAHEIAEDIEHKIQQEQLADDEDYLRR